MNRTQKELKPIIKNEVDAFITELMNKYPEIAKTSLEQFVKDEVGKAIFNIAMYGTIK